MDWVLESGMVDKSLTLLKPDLARLSRGFSLILVDEEQSLCFWKPISNPISYFSARQFGQAPKLLSWAGLGGPW